MYLLFSMLPSRATGTEVTILYRAIGRSINFFFLKVFSCVEKYVRKKCIEKKNGEIQACHLAPSPKARSLLINWFWRRLREII